MPKTVNVYPLPRFADSTELAGGTAVAIDVLRATTTITVALAAGAREVIPCLEVADARVAARHLDRERIVLGGERGRVLIEGFDLGNSPAEYTADAVSGKTVIFTTTNGTRALLHAQAAAEILLGAFINVTALCARLAPRDEVHLVCAGTEGNVGADDLLLAGLLACRLRASAGDDYSENDDARAARQLWLNAFSLDQALGRAPLAAADLAAELSKSPGGIGLLGVDMQSDILYAATLDRCPAVAAMDRQTLRIRL
jgi:2-phosphosulfolactate phosphatase